MKVGGNMLILILKLIIDLIFFDKEEGVNIFLLTDHEIETEFYNLIDNEKNNDQMAHDQSQNFFPIFIGKEQIQYIIYNILLNLKII